MDEESAMAQNDSFRFSIAGAVAALVRKRTLSDRTRPFDTGNHLLRDSAVSLPQLRDLRHGCNE
jgi:hypothetical protein